MEQAQDSKPEFHMYLIRLENLAMREVEGLKTSDIDWDDLNADYRHVIEWNSDRLIIGTADGIRVFRFR